MKVPEINSPELRVAIRHGREGEEERARRGGHELTGGGVPARPTLHRKSKRETKASSRRNDPLWRLRVLQRKDEVHVEAVFLQAETLLTPGSMTPCKGSLSRYVILTSDTQQA